MYNDGEFDRIVDSLNRKLADAETAKDEIREAQQELEEKADDLELYTEDLQRLIDNLESIPAVDVSIDINIDFSS